jgi:hypothetical protein
LAIVAPLAVVVSVDSAALGGAWTGVSPAAAALRAAAMDVSDEWVAQGCDSVSPLVAEERALLVRSYASLLSAVHR